VYSEYTQRSKRGNKFYFVICRPAEMELAIHDRSREQSGGQSSPQGGEALFQVIFCYGCVSTGRKHCIEWIVKTMKHTGLDSLDQLQSG
jgi:hypothetical protein